MYGVIGETETLYFIRDESLNIRPVLKSEISTSDIKVCKNHDFSFKKMLLFWGSTGGIVFRPIHLLDTMEKFYDLDTIEGSMSINLLIRHVSAGKDFNENMANGVYDYLRETYNYPNYECLLLINHPAFVNVFTDTILDLIKVDSIYSRFSEFYVRDNDRYVFMFGMQIPPDMVSNLFTISKKDLIEFVFGRTKFVAIANKGFSVEICIL